MDAHTHRYSSDPHVYILSPKDLSSITVESDYVCPGIHPWHLNESHKTGVIQWSKNSKCVGIGETGLDRLYPDFDRQLESFLWHWDLAEELGKPLVLHIVKTSSDLFHLIKKRRPKTPWLWHDFQGSHQEISEALKFHPQMHFSFGPRSVKKTNFANLWQTIPHEQRLIETDDSGVSILEVLEFSKVSKSEVENNFHKLFSI
jgi:TatD DNase family protein